jgi:tetratricopeptide (TPR) repeat protein
MDARALKIVIAVMLNLALLRQGYPSGKQAPPANSIDGVRKELYGGGLSDRKETSLRSELAELLYEAGNYKEAASEYELLLTHGWPAKEKSRLLRNKGVCHEMIGQYDNALRSFQEAITLLPRNAENHMDLGRVLEKINLPEDAINSYTKSIKFKANNPESNYGLGRIYQKLGLNAKAAGYYGKTLEQNPGMRDPEIYRRMSECYESLQKWDLSASMLGKAISISPETEDYINLSSLYVMQKKYTEATTLLNGLLKDNPGREDIMLSLASVYIKEKKYGMASNLLEDTLKLHPESGLAHFLLGLASYFNNDRSLAKKQALLSSDCAKSAMLKRLDQYFLEELGK